jgi:hypothetical protein
MSNVVSLESVKKDQAPAEKPSDKRLIEQCVIYAQSVAAFAAGCEVDCDDPEVDRHGDRAMAALKRIAKIPARTAEGLRAKAHILPIVIKDCEGCLNDEDKKFSLSLSADVKAFLQTIIDEDRPARHAQIVPIDGGEA